MATTSPLRQRMIEDMMIRNLSRATQQSYIYAVARFSRHFPPIVSAWRRSAPTNCISGSITSKPARSGFPNLTKSEKAVANYMVTHLKSLPYKTAASIAESTGVSSMTVSRFLRGLGYNGLSELKEQLRTELESTPLLISDRLARIRKASKRGSRRRGDLTAPTTEFLLKPRPQTRTYAWWADLLAGWHSYPA